MKKLPFRSCVLLIAALTFGAITSAPAAPPGSYPGRLIIYRAANLGYGLFLDINIDGANAATLGTGQTYDAPLAAGQHVLSVMLRPNQLFLSPTKMTLTVQSGKTYVLTAMWQGQNLVLR